MYGHLALLAGFILVYSVVAKGVERSWISGPIVFTAFGLIVGPLGLGVLPIDPRHPSIKTMAELALALVLFTDAAGVDLRLLRRTLTLPGRLLLIGLPLTILLGYGVGVVVFDHLALLEIAVLATMLAPTDAALGQTVITNTSVPATLRQSLNIESGLNDGICVPVLLVFLAFAGGNTGEEGAWQLALGFLTEELGIGVVIGLALTVGAVGLLQVCKRRDWLSPTWSQVTVISVALACFALAQAFGGSGFIAAFMGGLLFGAWLTPEDRDNFLQAAEGTGNIFTMLTWIIFGGGVVAHYVHSITWPVVLYAILSLTLIRMLPVFVALSGSGVKRGDKLFVGWFGPRGLASIVFAVIVLHSKLPHSDVLAQVVACTVSLSIVLHGVTATPWARAYGK